MQDYKLAQLEYHSVLKQRIDLLIKFVNSQQNPKEYLIGDKPLNEKLLKFSIPIIEKELENSRAHEFTHKKVWDKYGAKSEFRKEISGQGRKFVVDMDFDTVSQDWSKDKVVNVLKEVSMAAYRNSFSYDECRSDLELFEILSGNIKSYPLSVEENRMIKNKYQKTNAH